MQSQERQAYNSTHRTAAFPVTMSDAESSVSKFKQKSREFFSNVKDTLLRPVERLTGKKRRDEKAKAAVVAVKGIRHIFFTQPIPPFMLDTATGFPKQTFASNVVITSKYTLFTFLPKNLFEQFRRIANTFFLLLAILQFFPQYETLNPFVSALPFLIIIGLTAAKDGFEDWKRHKTDHTVNNRISLVLSVAVGRTSFAAQSLLHGTRNTSLAGFTFICSMLVTGSPIWPTGWSARRAPATTFKISCLACFKTTTCPQICSSARSRPSRSTTLTPYPTPSMDDLAKASSLKSAKTVESPLRQLRPDPNEELPHWTPVFWKDVAVGDIVLLRNNEFIPADIMLLSTSETEDMCYVETKNLDGETNLKPRRGLGVPESEALRCADACSRFQMRIDSEPPTTNLFSYSGTVVITPESPNTSVDKGRPSINPPKPDSDLLPVMKHTVDAIPEGNEQASESHVRVNFAGSPEMLKAEKSATAPEIAPIPAEILRSNTTASANMRANFRRHSKRASTVSNKNPFPGDISSVKVPISLNICFSVVVFFETPSGPLEQ